LISWLAAITGRITSVFEPHGGPSGEGNPPTLVEGVRVRGFRTLRDAAFRPGPLAALVGEAGTGKSNLLAAIRAVLDPAAAPLTPDDLAGDSRQVVRIDVEAANNVTASIEGTPGSVSVSKNGDLPPVVFLPALLRAGEIVAPLAGGAAGTELARSLIDQMVGAHSRRLGTASHPAGTTEAAHGLVAAIEAWQRSGLSGAVVLIEEPELFLPPQSQRYLYRMLRLLAAGGNQVIYSTHAPSFLNVARLHELVLTERDPAVGTRLVQPPPLPTDDEFRAFSEFDAARSELFLARAAILVEGQTERLTLPFVFRALGYDADRERISIIECGGKPNIPLVARISEAVAVPFVIIHDRDAPPGRRPIQAEQQLNDLIGTIAGPNRIELAPDFEGIAGLRGRRRKPARAWRSFMTMSAAEVPPTLAKAVERAVALARR
jgi:hypothetical protein